MGPIRTAPGVWFRCCRILVAIVLATNLLGTITATMAETANSKPGSASPRLQPESK